MTATKTSKGEMKAEHRNDSGKHTMYTASNFETMKEYFYNEYLGLYGTTTASFYKSWCDIYAALYCKASGETRANYVKHLRAIEEHVNKKLKEEGINARIEANAKINFDSMANVWDTICTIE